MPKIATRLALAAGMVLWILAVEVTKWLTGTGLELIALIVGGTSAFQMFSVGYHLMLYQIKKTDDFLEKSQAEFAPFEWVLRRLGL